MRSAKEVCFEVWCLSVQLYPGDTITEKDLADCWQTAYAAGRADQRERDAGVAMEHECGFDDDIVCNHLNCGMLISAAIRKGGDLDGKEG